MITYKTVTEVYLDDKKVGEIKEKNGHFIYFPIGDKTGGEAYLTLK